MMTATLNGSLRMGNEISIRPAPEFRHELDKIRGKCLVEGKKCPSITDITKKVAEQVDWEKLYHDEFNGQ